MKFQTTAARHNAVSTVITTSRGAKVYSVDQTFAFSNDQIYSNNASTQWFDQRTTVKTTTTATWAAGLPASSHVLTEDYPFSGLTTYLTFEAPAAEAIPRRVELPAGRRSLHPEAGDRGGYTLNTTIDHKWVQSLAHAGPADVFRLGLSDRAVAIHQKADAYLDSSVGGNGTNWSELKAANASGCYSHLVAGSVVAGITTDVQGAQCP